MPHRACVLASSWNSLWNRPLLDWGSAGGPIRGVPWQVPRRCICWFRSLTGNRRQLKSPLYATEDEAEVELTKLLKQVDEQRHPKSKISVSQLVEKWFEVAEPEDSTRERYEGLNRKYIEPVIGSTQFVKLDRSCWRGSTPDCGSANTCATGARDVTTCASRSELVPLQETLGL